MVDYTLSSYEEALKSYDKNIEDLNGRCSKEIDDLTEVFNRTQGDVQNDQFLSLSEKSRVLKKRQGGFDKLKKEMEDKFRAELEAEAENKENFMAQNGGFDYHCFVTLGEINKLKEKKFEEVNQDLAKKQEELARLQAEIESKQQEANNLKLDLESIQSRTLHEAFYEFDVMPRINKVAVDLKEFEEKHKQDYAFPQDFVGRTIRCLIKECKKQKKSLNYEGGKLRLSFDTVENRTKGDSEELKSHVINILTDCGFVISKMRIEKADLKQENVDISTNLGSRLPNRYESVGSNELYLREILLSLDKNDIQGRIDIIKKLRFNFADEGSFIKQIETARSEGVDIIEAIDKWILLYIVNKSGSIEPRTSDDKKSYFKISLDCRQRNPRILMTMDPDMGGMVILCVAPHVDYDNILRGQTKNYFQTWKGNWSKKGKQGKKTGRA